MTNADKIRAMTDEELAGIISCQMDDCPNYDYDNDCIKCMVDWLQKEAE